MYQKIKSFLFHNQTERQTVAKNTVWLTISNFGGRLIKAAIVIYGARILGTAGWGVFSYALTLAGFFTLFIDPGVNALVMRETPKADEKGKLEILSTTFLVKAVLIVLIALVVLFVAPLFSKLPGATALLPLVALIITFDSIREFLSSFIRAEEKMEQEAGIFILTNIAIVAAGFAFLAFSKTPLAFAWAYTAGTAIGAIAAVWALWGRARQVFQHVNFAMIRPILTSAWPFAITGALGLLLTNTDILILSWIRNASEVGIYSAGIRIIQSAYLLPVIIQYSTIPLLARLAGKDNERFRAVFERGLVATFIASVPLALGAAVLGTQAMVLLFGAPYAPGGLAFKILMITMLVDYPATIISAAIFTYDHQRSLIASSAIGGAINVGLDLILIPHYGIAGSAVATLIAQTASNAYLWHTMNKLNPFSVLPKLKKIALAGVLMTIVCAFLSSIGVHIIANVIICTIVYGGLLVLLREPTVKFAMESVFERKKAA